MRTLHLEGQTFGRLTVLARTENRGSLSAWRCRCACGAETTRTTKNLRSGGSLSCGCLRAETTTEMRTTHGQRHTPEWGAWQNAKNRTGNASIPGWEHYGGRGITMHPAWREDFSQFLAAVGPRPSPRHTLERLDVNGNYEPGNVVWATRQRQALNSRPLPLPVSGFRGVYANGAGWRAALGRTHLGTFSTPEEASATYEKARAELLLEVMQDPELEARYLKGVLPLVAEVKVGRTWAETH